MAALSPQEKAAELIRTYGDMLDSGSSIGEMDYMRGVRELEKLSSANSYSALGFLHAIAGKIERANSVFEKGLVACNDDSLAINYCFMLDRTSQYTLLREVVYSMARRFESKDFTQMAYFYAYRFGDREALIEFMDKHIKLLSDSESRELAEKQKLELISELNDAYENAQCTQRQIWLLSTITHLVIRGYRARAERIEVSENGSKSYVIDIINKDAATIAEMNFSLATAICAESELDGCELIARFSAFRHLHVGGSYGCYVK
jgi:hypothetical protein